MATRLLVQYRVNNSDEFVTVSLPPDVAIPSLTPENVDEVNAHSDLSQFLVPFLAFIAGLSDKAKPCRLYRIAEETTPCLRKPELGMILDLIAEYDEHGRLTPLVLRSPAS